MPGFFSRLKNLFRSKKPTTVAECTTPDHDAIGRYRVLRELGRGGMGRVVLAEDPFIERRVAIKTTNAPSPANPLKYDLFVEKFFHEARAVGRLNHPNIVGVYDALLEGGQCYLVMEYVEGANLSGYIKPDKPLGINTAVKIAWHCAKGLEYAHQHGVIHRDIKPSNIMVSSKSEVKLSDFGIASIEGRPDRQDGQVTGSVGYASPEQLRNEPLTPQSDIFSLGVVIYELLTGRKPFEADNAMAVIYKILNEDPEPVKKHRPDCPDLLEKIVMLSLSKEPGKRQRTDLHLASDLSASFRHLRFIQDEIHFEEKFNVIKKLKFFRDFATGELMEVLEASQWIKHEPASVVVREDETTEDFFVIVTGQVIARKRGRNIAVLGPGDVFGEISGAGPMPQLATFLAKTPTVILKISQAFISRTAPATQLRFFKVFNERLMKNLAVLSRRLVEKQENHG